MAHPDGSDDTGHDMCPEGCSACITCDDECFCDDYEDDLSYEGEF